MIINFENWIYWLIIATGFISYIGLFDLLFDQKEGDWLTTRNRRAPLIQTALASLPLLGLLGTIVGLLQTFQEISQGQSDTLSMLSGGLGMALGSTQLGLILAVPGLLLMHILLASNSSNGANFDSQSRVESHENGSKEAHSAI